MGTDPGWPLTEAGYPCCPTCGTVTPTRSRSLSGWSWCPSTQTVHPSDACPKNLPPEHHVVPYVREATPAKERP